MKQLDSTNWEATHFCLFAGMGGLSLGLSRGHARVGTARMRLRCLGGIDVWPAAARDFGRVTGAAGTSLDLFDRADYEAFHGRPPPGGWTEATVDDVRRAAGGEFPDILATSPPCKGFSGLLSPTAARSDKYQALNRLTIRGLALALAAFADDPPALVLLENVPRIQTRGRDLVDTITSLLRAHGYAVAETTHDCGALGGLAQHRRRFLLVARHVAKVRPFLYEPPLRRVRGIGEVLGQLPLPGAPHAGPMHRLPRLTWLTWLRLALIEAGKDWRSLHHLAVEDGHLRDIGLVPVGAEWHGGILGVKPWQAPAGTVTIGGATRGAFNVADPRTPDQGTYQPYGVVQWTEPARTVTGQSAAGSGPYSVQDPRLPCDVEDLHGRRHNNVLRLVRWAEASPAVTAGTGPSGGALSVADPRALQLGQHSGKMAVQDWATAARTVTGSDRVGSGAQCVADPRCPWDRAGKGKYRVAGWTTAAGTVVGASTTGQGAFAVSDPRMAWGRDPGGNWSTGGHYGVNAWDGPAPTVTARAKLDRGAWSVSDPRVLPAAQDRGTWLLVALDGTWHRPLTTLELAALQGYPVFGADGAPLTMEGQADSGWRERIGNSVPPPAAQAIGSEMARTLLLEALDESFALSATPVWVRPFATALAVAGA